MSFTMSNNPQFLWLRITFKQYFYDWLVFFKQQDGNIFENKKKFISQQTRKWFKITTNSNITGSSFFLKIEPDTF